MIAFKTCICKFNQSLLRGMLLRISMIIHDNIARGQLYAFTLFIIIQELRSLWISDCHSLLFLLSLHNMAFFSYDTTLGKALQQYATNSLRALHRIHSYKGLLRKHLKHRTEYILIRSPFAHYNFIESLILHHLNHYHIHNAVT